MGNNLAIDESELASLAQRTKYSEETLRGMHGKFTKLDRQEKGYVSVADLAQLPDFKSSELSGLVSKQFSSGIADQVDFKKLVGSLAGFRNNHEDLKLRCTLL